MINKKIILSALSCLTVFSNVKAADIKKTERTEKDKPNVLFIFADDLTIEGLGAYNKDVKTPNLDRLRNSGAFFNHAYNQGSWSAAISAASRGMLNTGKYLWKAAKVIEPNLNLYDSWPVDAKPYKHVHEIQNTLWGNYMKQAGYDTYFSGKWHVNNHSPFKAFDKVEDPRGGMAQQSQDCYDRLFIKGKPDKWTPYDKSYGGYWKGGTHWSVVLGNDGVGYIDEAAKKDKPFFMYLAFNAPHDPRQSPKSFLDMYPADSIKVPENFLPYYPYADNIGCGKKLRDAWLAPFPRTEWATQVNRQEYYALITHMDVQIGRLLDELEKSGKLDNTYIFFTADHGILIGEHGLFGKQNMYEPSVCVPLLVSGPGIPKNSTVSDFVYLQDVMATALDIAKSKELKNVDFHSLLPLAQGKSHSNRKAIYSAYMGLQRMVRTTDYKMIIYPTINKVLLYDLHKDPLEMNDLATDLKNKPLMDKLLITLKDLQKETSDPLDIVPFYNHFFENQENFKTKNPLSLNSNNK